MRAHVFPTLLVSAAAAFAAGPARAETWHSCTGFIDALPATITAAGTWCLRRNLGTSIASGDAILIANNRITIDCNGRRITGLAAGPGTNATGIRAVLRHSVTVRNCEITGFIAGVAMVDTDGGDHVIEDNRIVGNTYVGIYVQGPGSVIRRNAVVDTGRSSATTLPPRAIETSYGVSVVDNAVRGVLAPEGNVESYKYGIYLGSGSGVVARNHVSELEMTAGDRYGIYAPFNGALDIRDNTIDSATTGIFCTYSSGVAHGNVVGTGGVLGCTSSGNFGQGL
jgi:parallel beta-helix repeat protein